MGLDCALSSRLPDLSCFRLGICCWSTHRISSHGCFTLHQASKFISVHKIFPELLLVYVRRYYDFSVKKSYEILWRLFCSLRRATSRARSLPSSFDIIRLVVGLLCHWKIFHLFSPSEITNMNPIWECSSGRFLKDPSDNIGIWFVSKSSGM